jgi:hypothetical protein
MTDRIIVIQDANGHQRDILRRTADLPMMYDDYEVARLAIGLPVYRGDECHLDLEAWADRVASARAEPARDLLTIAACAAGFVFVAYFAISALLSL